MNAFHWNTGNPSPLNNAKEREAARRSTAQTAIVEKLREEGVSVGVITGISRKADERIRKYRKGGKA